MSKVRLTDADIWKFESAVIRTNDGDGGFATHRTKYLELIGRSLVNEEGVEKFQQRADTLCVSNQN